MNDFIIASIKNMCIYLKTIAPDFQKLHVVSKRYNSSISDIIYIHNMILNQTPNTAYDILNPPFEHNRKFTIYLNFETKKIEVYEGINTTTGVSNVLVSSFIPILPILENIYNDLYEKCVNRATYEAERIVIKRMTQTLLQENKILSLNSLKKLQLQSEETDILYS